MNSMKIKKTLIKLLPYIIVGLVCTNLGEAWRLAEGADMGKKMLSFFSMVGVAAGTALSTSEVDTADPTKYNMILSIAEGDYTYARMADRSLRSSEVPLADLRYVKVLHYDHDGEIRVGELVVHKDILDDVTAIFAELFEKKYPITTYERGWIDQDDFRLRRIPAGGVNGGQDVLTAVQLSLITRRWGTITLFAGRSG